MLRVESFIFRISERFWGNEGAITSQCDAGCVLQPAKRGLTALSRQRSKRNRQEIAVPAPPMYVDFIDFPIFVVLALDRPSLRYQGAICYAAIGCSLILSSLNCRTEHTHAPNMPSPSSHRRHWRTARKGFGERGCRAEVIQICTAIVDNETISSFVSHVQSFLVAAFLQNVVALWCRLCAARRA